MTSPARRLLLPSVMTVAMLVVLIGLGSWQVQRLRWKSAILEEVALAEARPGQPLPPDPAPFAKVIVTGRLRPAPTALFGAEVRTLATGPAMGARRIGILDRPVGKPVLVDLGWVPAGHAVAVPDTEVTLQGYVHPGDTASWFSASDDLSGRHFYTLDPARIATALGVADALPLVIIALGPTPADRWPDPAKHLPQPPNNHLIYAVTWYGFAVTLVVIFLLWARKAIRS